MKILFTAVTLACLALPTLCAGAEFQTPGALGTGRAGIARITDAYATFWNPAGLAFYQKPFSAKLNAGAAANISSSLADNIDKIGKLDIGTNKLSIPATATPQQALDTATRAVEFIGILDDLDRRKGELTINADAALGFQYRNFGLGIIGGAEVGSGVATVDMLNINTGNQATLGTPAQNINDLATAIGAVSPVRTATILSQAQYDQAVNSFVSSGNGGVTQATAQAIVSTLEAQLANNNTAGLSAEQMTRALVLVANSTTGGNIDNNTTSVELRGLLLAEIPLGYGYKFDLGAFGKIGVGGAVKAMRGIVYSQEVKVNDPSLKKSSDLLKKVRDSKTESTTFGVDLGVMWRYEDLPVVGPLTISSVVKNINSPEFDAPKSGVGIVQGFTKVKVEPQARIGIALEPFSWLLFVADADLTKNKTILPGRNSQNIGAGVELTPASFFALRLGLFENIAVTSTKPVYTAGLSIGPHWLRLDVDAAMSTETGRYDNKKYPREAKVEVGLSTMF